MVCGSAFSHDGAAVAAVLTEVAADQAVVDDADRAVVFGDENGRATLVEI